MVINKGLRSRGTFLGMTALVVALLAGPLTSSRASAQISYCRADPIVTLSNGTEIDITAKIYASSAQVKSITYALHAPVGTSVTSMVYTAGGLGIKETLSFSDDLPSGYSTTTNVATASSQFQVAATSSLRGGASGSASGYSNQNLTVNL